MKKSLWWTGRIYDKRLEDAEYITKYLEEIWSKTRSYNDLIQERKDNRRFGDIWNRDYKICHGCGKKYYKNKSVCVNIDCLVKSCEGNCKDAVKVKPGTKYCSFCKEDSKNKNNGWLSKNRLSINKDKDAPEGTIPEHDYDSLEDENGNFVTMDFSNNGLDNTTRQERRKGPSDKYKPTTNGAGRRIRDKNKSLFDKNLVIHGYIDDKKRSDNKCTNYIPRQPGTGARKVKNSEIYSPNITNRKYGIRRKKDDKNVLNVHTVKLKKKDDKWVVIDPLMDHWNVEIRNFAVLYKLYDKIIPSYCITLWEPDTVRYLE